METYALVGPSGTGKSFRAIVVAYQYGAEAIIDDGLLIQGSSVLAGSSAKRQKTKVGAIKTALFLDPEQAEEVKTAISKCGIKRILILGTSKEMAQRIAERLNLPKPRKVINISEIAKPWEIEKAKHSRKLYGKHIIPAPTVEVKPKLSGTLIEPLQTWLGKQSKSRTPHHRLLIEQSVVRPTFNYLGKFFIANNVIPTIFTWTVEQIDGINRVNKVDYQENNEGIIIDCEVTAYYGNYLPSVAKEIQIRARREIEYMTSLHIEAINVYFKNIVKKDEGNREKSLDFGQNKIAIGSGS